MFRFNGPIVFFNAAHFKRSVLAAADGLGAELRWFVLDMLPVTMIDATGLLSLRETFDVLGARGVVVATAGRQMEWLEWARCRGMAEADFRALLFPTLRRARRAFQSGGDPEARPTPEAPR